MEVGLSSHFKKGAKRLSKQEREALDLRTAWFQRDSSYLRLKTHSLAGSLKGYFSFSISFGKRVKYVLVAKNKAIFVDVGAHDEVYR
jgi:mRNA-degrading endonuclease YafQ of YafQ-DinJ toxin-antitoxin module